MVYIYINMPAYKRSKRKFRKRSSKNRTRSIRRSYLGGAPKKAKAAAACRACRGHHRSHTCGMPPPKPKPRTKPRTKPNKRSRSPPKERSRSPPQERSRTPPTKAELASELPVSAWHGAAESQSGMDYFYDDSLGPSLADQKRYDEYYDSTMGQRGSLEGAYGTAFSGCAAASPMGPPVTATQPAALMSTTSDTWLPGGVPTSPLQADFPKCARQPPPESLGTCTPYESVSGLGDLGSL
jgi:hypothetical protein